MEEKHRKFVCKYCFKRFPCGKSLGGHIRTHMTEERNNAAAIGDAEHVAAAAAAGDAGNLIYGLRENPKKTMRFVHSHHHHAAAVAATTLEQNEMIKFCKECGKGFPSLKALCGHMASHSEKEKTINKAMMEEDTQSDDTDDVCVAATTMNLRKSKRRVRFKSLTLSNHQPSSSSVNGGSSSVSEMEQEQQEEVARCLMLLSRDFFGHKGRFVSESSDNNNEIVLETKSKIVIRNGNKFVANNAREFVEKKKKLKMVGIGVSNNSDSRDFRYGSKKIKFVDSSVSSYEFKRPKVEADKSGFEDCRGKYNNNVTTMFKKSGMMNKDLDHDTNFDSRKKANSEGFSFSNKNEEIYENGSKSLKYEFYGYEKDNDISYDSVTDVESDEENSSESDSFPAAKSHTSKAVNRKKLSSIKGKKKKLKSKKSKEYECPICYKIFRSGQALGGHKRSHFVGGSEENTFVIKQAAAAAAAVAVPCLIDLNLPAPVDE